MDAVVARSLTKHFRKSALSRTHTTVKASLIRWLRRQQGPEQSRLIEVLKDVSFSIPRGSTVGIIGRNGSGKSTLLKLITGIYRPSSGTLEVNGRISALLELGAGFHPDFTGRENILINGVILGMSRAEVKSRMDEIIAFSELGDFIDEPVRTYSSGMYMRLAFAIATHVDPEILIVDEILAVGDDHFSRKSMAKMNEFKDRGKTILLVTHDLATVQRWCDRAIWLDRGGMAADGRPDEVVNQYRRTVAQEEMSAPDAPSAVVAQPAPVVDAPSEPAPAPRPQTGTASDQRWGSFKVEISAVRILDRNGREKQVFDVEEPLTIELEFVSFEPVEDVVFGVGIFQADGLRVYGTNTHVDGVPLPRPFPERGTVRIDFARLGFIDGNYVLDVAAHTVSGEMYDMHRQLYRFAVRSAVPDVGVARPPHGWRVSGDSGRLSEAVAAVRVAAGPN